MNECWDDDRKLDSWWTRWRGEKTPGHEAEKIVRLDGQEQRERWSQEI